MLKKVLENIFSIKLVSWIINFKLWIKIFKLLVINNFIVLFKLFYIVDVDFILVKWLIMLLIILNRVEKVCFNGLKEMLIVLKLVINLLINFLIWVWNK